MKRHDISHHISTLTHLREDAQLSLFNKYKVLNKELLIICKELLDDDNLETNNLRELINLIKQNGFIDVEMQKALHCFRIDADRVLDLSASASQELLDAALDIILALCTDDKNNLQQNMADFFNNWRKKHIKQENVANIKRLRCTFEAHAGEDIIVIPDDDPTMTPITVSPYIDSSDRTFGQTVAMLEKGMKLNLVDSHWENGIVKANMIVIEPDYLMDISALADCIKEYGQHPANYYFKLLTTIDRKRPLILGNIVNLFLDEWIYTPNRPDYINCMKKVFKRNALELIACDEIDLCEKEFFNDCQTHFNNIDLVVNRFFNDETYTINSEDAVLEPSYICETLGLQGRLDYMQRDLSSFIEMKSGKADEFTVKGQITPQLSNNVQMMLYLAILEYSLGVNHQNVKAYLLYTRYPKLCGSAPSWEIVRRTINARNRIVACEYQLNKNNSLEYASSIIGQINEQSINEYHTDSVLWKRFIAPRISEFRNQFLSNKQIYRTYYLSLFNFISKELYLSKIGNGEQDRNSSSSVWDLTTTEKTERGIIITDMRISENRIFQIHCPYIKFSYKLEKENAILNFRNGDMVIVYERNSSYDKATNKMIFKGNIEDISNSEIKIRLRSPQRNPKVINEYSTFALEPDYSDKATMSMFESLNSFINANEDRKQLLLGLREPEFDENIIKEACAKDNDFERIALKSMAAKDMMLVIGPPGTGKTSWALRMIVEKHLENRECNILLISFTNRAVDEICKSLSNIRPEIDYIRLGNELSCDEKYREHLIENKLSKCNKRREAKEVIGQCHIFVSTIVTLQNKPEIFALKQFDCAIIDEATQILEPQIIGILSAKTRKGENAIKKFIMIGDNKQLPAITLQSDNDAMIKEKSLTEIGFESFKKSLFERLYIKYSTSEHICLDMLCKQGRMHKDIAEFSNKNFYFDKLIPLGLEHQLEKNDEVYIESKTDYKNIARMRMAFIPSCENPGNYNDKTNDNEAQIVANLAFEIYERDKENFDSDKTLGIIAPYKNQIALIKKYISEKGIEALDNITVDTVERYQGSERDTIIFSFCVNKPYQLKMMSNIIIENGHIIDRKLNVALTRARKQLFLTGNPTVLSKNLVYNTLIEYMKEKVGYINLC